MVNPRQTLQQRIDKYLAVGYHVVLDIDEIREGDMVFLSARMQRKKKELLRIAVNVKMPEITIVQAI